MAVYSLLSEHLQCPDTVLVLPPPGQLSLAPAALEEEVGRQLQCLLPGSDVPAIAWAPLHAAFVADQARTAAATVCHLALAPGLCCASTAPCMPGMDPEPPEPAPLPGPRTDRGTQTPRHLPRSRQVQTQSAPRATACGQCDAVHSAALELLEPARCVLERMLMQNALRGALLDCRYWDDPADEVRAREGTLLPLWLFPAPGNARHAVTALAWCPGHPDLFAVGHGGFDPAKPLRGAVAVHSLKAPSRPELTLRLPTGVMCLAFHPVHADVLAVGCHDGSLHIYSLMGRLGQAEDAPAPAPLYASRLGEGGRWEPMWQDLLSIHAPPIEGGSETEDEEALDLADVAWLPGASVVFAAATENGRVHVFDLSKDRRHALCVQKLANKTKLTKLAFNPKEPLLLVGDDRSAKYIPFGKVLANTMVGGVHPIPGNGHVPAGKIIGPVLGLFTAVAAVFYARHTSATVPNTISRDWEDASVAYAAAAPFEGAPDKVAFLNPFFNSIPPAKAVRPAE
ncbi:Dynein, 78 kDa intermediate chain, flagellar outer arm [Auxenochlorella protothecoides]|uniref:Dynein, 78 kDa intermediate chain, flagellar outer arm n=1 Tax=Auxenochlorella protothecoides TaxID=3075 RepID=A0A087SBZ5_AUXPR|nr:Dynein, 78 kDa intermediate chain, flagellar outer arm [Auxenochlorella protothecoides]KFM23249.1 Dynein, 78 kDa intermediate chain, flagellar outer arm [Auxenochlorella protothecoides]